MDMGLTVFPNMRVINSQVRRFSEQALCVLLRSNRKFYMKSYVRYERQQCPAICLVASCTAYNNRSVIAQIR